MAESERPITIILQAAAGGDSRAAAELLPLVYDELRRLAHARMARSRGDTLQPTALVHEAYLRLIGDADPGWNSRGHFFAAAAQAMRNILVDQARRKATVKHGGDRVRLEAEANEPTIETPVEDILTVDEMIKRLEAEDPRKGQIVNLRYFVGLSAEDTAAALGISLRTVEREWRYIRTWLRQQLDDGSAPGEAHG